MSALQRIGKVRCGAFFADFAERIIMALGAFASECGVSADTGKEPEATEVLMDQTGEYKDGEWKVSDFSNKYVWFITSMLWEHIIINSLHICRKVIR